MTLDVEVLPDPEAACRRAAELIAQALARAITDGGRGAWAISGGETPMGMFRRLGQLELSWSSIETWQVDERIAPPGDAERNRTRQEAALPAAALDGVRWMPVEDEDVDSAAERYAATLPERFDVVHLGLGADGHTASLVPGDPVLEVTDHDVAVTRPYRGHRRLTLTFPGLAHARSLVWLVTGADKRDAMRSLLAGDRSLPAARVAVADQLLVADAAASG
jgi:6-phosphogluconolactonase